ncbi:MAG TPA: rod shape-determining protein MreC [Acidimicrobiales bacterium]
MPRSRRSRRTLTFIVLIVVSLSIISLDLNGRTHSLTSGIKSVANDVFNPLRHGVSALLDPIGNFFAGAVHYGDVQHENQQLSALIGQLEQQKAEKGFENVQLRDLLALQHLPFIGSQPVVTAETEQQDTSNFTQTITIDKGRSDGVDVGMPVVGAGGLVGVIIQSFHNSAVVQMVTDGQSKVGVTFGTAGASGIVDGQGPGSDMTCDLVPPHTTLHKGETLYTSGLDAAAFPPGIPVAHIEAFHTSPGASQESITVDPAADLNQLEYVDVVQWVPPL